MEWEHKDVHQNETQMNTSINTSMNNNVNMSTSYMMSVMNGTMTGTFMSTVVDGTSTRMDEDLTSIDAESSSMTTMDSITTRLSVTGQESSVSEKGWKGLVMMCLLLL